MNCDRCGQQPATIHLTDVVNDEKTEHHLCEPCYEQSELALPFGDDEIMLESEDVSATLGMHAIQQMTSGLEGDPITSSKTCSTCGIDVTAFQKRGAVGCADDYEVFAEEFEPILIKLHGGRRHVGKSPKDFETQRARDHQVAQLQAELQRAVRDEAYEEAARLRDRISALENRTAES